ncbi:hypothetical protein [Clostridium cibarium]|uniref:Uncharacterized protein n=1 Tax=Clostridium cibarium TaxID=2762247 RepID=A0ABR8PTM5_9CLOT|nr:hypothetical protein [Clostridium cibarium]MBD7911526.1 hypothetical protein [Clostridium cibarium]
MSNIHDNEIISYKVNLKNQKIIIYTEYQKRKITKKTDVIFYDVLVHFFENELPGSTILDIDEHNINQFIRDNSKLLEQRKDSCWPIDYNTIEELTRELLKEQYSYYIISSSYGLNGWVLAKSYEMI